MANQPRVVEPSIHYFGCRGIVRGSRDPRNVSISRGRCADKKNKRGFRPIGRLPLTAPRLDFSGLRAPLPGENKDPGLRNLAAGARLTPRTRGQQASALAGVGSRRSSGHGSDSIPGAPGGARGPATAGASVISPRCRRIRRMAPGSITALTIRIRPWQRRHSSASTTNTLFSSSAQGRRYGDGSRTPGSLGTWVAGGAGTTST